MGTSRTTLNTLVRLRRQALDTARQLLTASLTREHVVETAHREAEGAIRRERDVATALDSADAAVEAFAAWLPRGRQALAQAETARTDAEAATAQARARLTTARAAVEALEQMLEDQATSQRAEAARKLQAALDEFGQRRRPVA